MDTVTETTLAVALQPTHELFALSVVEFGGNLGKAYKAVFGEDVEGATAKGAMLLRQPEILARVNQLTAAINEQSLISVGTHLTELAVIRDLAKAQGSFKVALEAEVNRGKVAGYYVNKEVNPPPPSVPASTELNQLAGRLVGLLNSARSQNGETVDVEAREVDG